MLEDLLFAMEVAKFVKFQHIVWPNGETYGGGWCLVRGVAF